MKIRFVTKDGLVAIADCPDIEEPMQSTMMRFIWPIPKTVYGEPTPKPNWQGDARKYEWRGEVEDGIPTFYEV